MNAWQYINDSILMMQLMCAAAGLLAIYFSRTINSFELFVTSTIFFGGTAYGAFTYAESMHLLYKNSLFFKQLVYQIAGFERELITTWDEVASWVCVLLSALATWAYLIIILLVAPYKSTIRGTEIFSEAIMCEAIKRKGRSRFPIHIGQFVLPLSLETRSLAIYGEPGSGKTQIILRIISDLIKRSNRFVCLDVGGDIYGSLGNPGDTVLSATHGEGVEYSPFADIHKKSDCNVIANSFIPKGYGDTQAWNGYARDVLTVILERCFELSKTTNKDLLYFACEAGIQTLQKLTIGTSVQRILDGENQKKVDDIMGIISQHLKPLTMFSPDAGSSSFSVRSWVKQNSGSNLWVIYEDASALASASLRAVWMNLLIQETLSLEPNADRRLCYVMDELASCGIIEGLSQAVSRGRKYGMSFVFAVQNLSQLYGNYGKDETHSILGSVGHTVLLRSPDPETAEYLSKSIGGVEIERDQVSTHGKGNGVNIQRVRETKMAVLPSEISGLKDLNGFIKIGGVGWARLRVPLIKLPRRNTLHVKLTDYQSSIKPKGDGSSPLSIDDV